jgi:hypothetical protein
MGRGSIHHIGAMTFNTESAALMAMTPATATSIGALITAMEAAELEGGTAVYKAVSEANRMARAFCHARASINALTIVVLTDGEDNSSSAACRSECRELDLRLRQTRGQWLNRCVIGLKAGAGARLAKNIGADLLGWSDKTGVDVNAVVKTHERYIEGARAAARAKALREAEARAAAKAKKEAEEALGTYRALSRAAALCVR